jgi:hypothetical protein
MVYADWLQSEGDPRGELIVVQHALESKDEKKLRDRAAAILDEHGPMLLGPLREHAKTMDSKQADAFSLRRGFLDSVRISYNSYAADDQPFDAPQFLADVLKHPSAALLREIVLAELNTGEWSNEHGSSQVYQPLIDAIANAKPQALRDLTVGEYEYPDDTEISWTWIGSLAEIWGACPRLRTLRVQGGSIELGKIVAPELESAAFVTGGLPQKAVRSIASASWPKLERLEVWLGAEEYGAGGTLEDVLPILDGKGLPKLKHLALKNCEFGDEIAASIGKSKILAQLDTLDLSMSILTDQGAQAMSSTASAFAHLSLLDVSDGYLGNEGVRLVEGLAKKVKTGDQREADEWDGEQHRYVAVGE